MPRPRFRGRDAVVIFLLLLAATAFAAVDDLDEDGYSGASEVRGGTHPLRQDDERHADVLAVQDILQAYRSTDGSPQLIINAQQWQNASQQLRGRVGEAIDWITPAVQAKHSLQGTCVERSLLGTVIQETCAWDLVEAGAPAAASILNRAESARNALLDLYFDIGILQSRARGVEDATQAFLAAPGHGSLMDLKDAYQHAVDWYEGAARRLDDVAALLRGIEYALEDAQRTLQKANRFDLLDPVFDTADDALEALEESVAGYRKAFAEPANKIRHDAATMRQASQAVRDDDLEAWVLGAAIGAAFLVLSVSLMVRRRRRK